MIVWKDTIEIIKRTFSVDQQRIADCLNVKQYTLSKIKAGKVSPPFSSEDVYQKIFNPENSRSPANDTARFYFNLLKERIESDFPNVRESLNDYWKEQDYKVFVLKLLDRTKSVPKKDTPVTSGTGCPPAPVLLRRILPEKSVLFGRESEIKRMEEVYKTANYVVLAGIGGIGKSQTALAYAHMLKEKGDWTIQHIICEDSDTLQEAICRLQFEAAPGDTGRSGVDRILDVLKDCQSNVLIIFDNLNRPFNLNDLDFQRLIRCGCQVRVLITSRNTLVDKRHRVDILPLDNNSLLELYAYHRFEDSSDHSSYIAEHKNVLDGIFALVERHTLMIMLLAKLPGQVF